MRPARVLPRHLLREAPPRWVEEDDPSLRPPQRLDARGQRLGLHDHAAAAPEGRVVRHAVLARGPVAQVVDTEVHEPALARSPYDGIGKRRLDHARE